MRQILIKYQVVGGHVHCRLFTAPAPDTTFALCGTLMFDIVEWPEIMGRLGTIAIVRQED